MASARAWSCSAAHARARSDLQTFEISASAVTRRFQIGGIRLQLKLGRRPQGARLISRPPEHLRARHRMHLDDADDRAAAVRHALAGRRRGADRMEADAPNVGEGSFTAVPAPRRHGRSNSVHDWGCWRSCPVAHELNIDSLQPCASRAPGCQPSLARHSRRLFGRSIQSAAPHLATMSAGARFFGSSTNAGG